MELARQSGLPFIEQLDFSNYISIILGCKFEWKTEDQSPQDDIVFKDQDTANKVGKDIDYYPSPTEVEELKNRQFQYMLNGGVLGSWTEVSARSTISLDLNIVYDEDQYNIIEAHTAADATVQDCKNTYGAVNIEFNVSFSPGKGDTSYINTDGSYGRIARGAKNGAINVLLFANYKFNGRSSSLYNPASEQIFMWEGSMYDKPTAKNAGDPLTSSAIAHELGHLFFYYAGLYMTESWLNNGIQDGQINYSLNQMRYNPLFFQDNRLSDYYNFRRDVNPLRLDFLAPRGSNRKPTSEQLLRLGAKKVFMHFKGYR